MHQRSPSFFSSDFLISGMLKATDRSRELGVPLGHKSTGVHFPTGWQELCYLPRRYLVSFLERPYRVSNEYYVLISALHMPGTS